MLAAVRAIYLESKKQHDNFWTEWVSRPPAALVVWSLRRLPITPNQVTFLSLAVFATAALLLLAWPTQAGLIAAACVVQLAYILDCADGQLARHRGIASPVGALLDFLMDELKALLLIAACAVRLWQGDARTVWLLLGVAGLFVAASGMALTAFVRRKEYLQAGGRQAATTTGPAPAANGRRSPWGTAIAAFEHLGKLVLHYPSYFLLIALVDRVDVFLYVYLTAHALYLGRTSLAVVIKLGRPLPRSEPPTPSPTLATRQTRQG